MKDKTWKLTKNILTPKKFAENLEKYELVIATFSGNEKADKLSMNNCLIIALYLLSQNKKNEQIPYTDWYAQIFVLFPEKFGLSADWPMLLDSEKINKRWRDIANKGLIKGSRKDGWVLTISGEGLAKKIIKDIGLPKGIKIDRSDMSVGRDIQVVLNRFNSIAEFTEWDGINQPDLAPLLQLTKVLMIPSASPTKEISRKLQDFLAPYGALSANTESVKRARLWLLYQSLNLIKFINKTDFTLNIQKYAKEEGIL